MKYLLPSIISMILLISCSEESLFQLSESEEHTSKPDLKSNNSSLPYCNLTFAPPCNCERDGTITRVRLFVHYVIQNGSKQSPIDVSYALSTLNRDFCNLGIWFDVVGSADFPDWEGDADWVAGIPTAFFDENAGSNFQNGALNLYALPLDYEDIDEDELFSSNGAAGPDNGDLSRVIIWGGRETGAPNGGSNMHNHVLSHEMGHILGLIGHFVGNNIMNTVAARNDCWDGVPFNNISRDAIIQNVNHPRLERIRTIEQCNVTYNF